MTDSYSEFVDVLAKDGQLILDDLNPLKAHLLHMAIGVCGEAGELVDAVKNNVIYNKSLDVTNVIEELGDLEFYMQGIRNALDISRETVIDNNKTKLGKRYHDGYSDRAAQERADKSEEI